MRRQDGEVPLRGGRVTPGVVRVGNTVRRPVTEASPFVARLLGHLERRGFAGAPRHLGLDAAGRDCVREVSMAKAYCGELVNEVMYDCLQFHGGMGYMRDTAIERLWRDARVLAIGGGATEVMLDEVAKRY